MSIPLVSNLSYTEVTSAGNLNDKAGVAKSKLPVQFFKLTDDVSGNLSMTNDSAHKKPKQTGFDYGSIPDLYNRWDKIDKREGGKTDRSVRYWAKEYNKFGYDEVNLNVGCPSNRVNSGCRSQGNHGSRDIGRLQ